ncbi:hypothetical protein CTAYLR_004668 [Chrysophaeum taylorii]|uniref:Ammonium transporter AmtB-like domain-containing protein n=1 Tax=Chrysophaeum taylorii TaxID=2483200 RepID=A0AAD7U833_9STRA|nr:hypothetical protein CTAYLR_004668 [Chrysophaeum taylorii]
MRGGQRRLPILWAVVVVAVVLAEEEADPTSALESQDGDAFWLLFGMALVFFMQAGFAMLEAGAAPTEVVGRVLLKNIFDASFASLLWWATGYSLAYGADDFNKEGVNGFIGTSGFFYEQDLDPIDSEADPKTYVKSFWLFQWAFAGVAATIVSGAVAGRCLFGAYIAYAITVSGLVYPVVVHNAWSKDGRFSASRTSRLLAGCGVVDFAGSGVVHMTGGVAALLMTSFLVARRGRFGDDHQPFEPPEPSGIVFQTLGALILWFGWYAFNGVSTLAITGLGGLAAHTMFTTTIAAATGCLATTSIASMHYYLGRRDAVHDAALVDVSYPINGILAGLVSITGSCAVVSHWGAMCVALVGSVVYYSTSRLLVYHKIDDVVDAFPVHGACGAWGVLSSGFFATEYYYKLAIIQGEEDQPRNRANRCQGVFYGGDGGTLLAAIAFIVSLVLWVSGVLYPLFSLLHHYNLIRIEDAPSLRGSNVPTGLTTTSGSIRGSNVTRSSDGDRGRPVVPTFVSTTLSTAGGRVDNSVLSSQEAQQVGADLELSLVTRGSIATGTRASVASDEAR